MTTFNGGGGADGPRGEMAYLLAQTILGLHGPDGKPHMRGADARLASGRVEVDIRMESMVRGMAQQIWMDAASIAASAEAAIREAVSKVDLEQVIKETVAAELARVRAELHDKVRREIDGLVGVAVHDAIGTKIAAEAKALAFSAWRTVMSDEPKK
jgi:hypothetical protein